MNLQQARISDHFSGVWNPKKDKDIAHNIKLEIRNYFNGKHTRLGEREKLAIDRAVERLYVDLGELEDD